MGAFVWVRVGGTAIGFWSGTGLLEPTGSVLEGSTRDDNLDVRQVVADHLLEVPFHFVSKHVILSFGVVGLAVVPDHLDMVEGFLDGAVLPGPDFVLHLQQVHGVFDDQRVVVEFEFLMRW